MRSLMISCRENSFALVHVKGVFAKLAVCVVVLLVACSGGELATQPSTDDNSLYWALALNYHAVTLSTVAPYDTIHLVATPLNPSGQTLAGQISATFTSSDLEHANVTEDGVVHAIGEGTNVLIIASMRADGVTHTDTTVITITADSAPPQLAHLSIHPVPPDSSKIAAAGNGKQLVLTAFDVSDSPFTQLTAQFRSLDPTVASVDQFGFVQGIRPGQARVIASATVYGITKADTVTFTIGLPILRIVSVAANLAPNATPPTIFTPSAIRVGVGSTIVWTWQQDF